MSNNEKKRQRMNELQLIANQVGENYTPEQIGIVQKNVAKGTSNNELAYFLNVCKTMELNPFNKEVWCYKDNKNNLLIFAGRDGFLSKAQKNPLFNGIRSIEIRENDEYSIDVLNNNVFHKITKPLKERGKILMGVAIVFRKDGEPTIEMADFDVYNKGYNTWRTHPGEMIKKVAETHALKKAFGISMVQSEYDFQDGKPIQAEIVQDDYSLDRLTELYGKLDENMTSHDELSNFERIIDMKEESSYRKAILRAEEIINKNKKQ